MKSFDSVYKSTKAAAIKSKNDRIEKDHAQIISAVKKTYGINDFGQLDESEREYYKSMINKMWNINEGMTPAGVDFINESKVPLTEKSKDEDIIKAITAEVNKNRAYYYSCVSNGVDSSEKMKKFLEGIKEQTGKKVNKATVVEIMMNAMSRELLKNVKNIVK